MEHSSVVGLSAFLVVGDKVYTNAGDNKQFDPFAGKRVKVTADVTNQNRCSDNHRSNKVETPSISPHENVNDEKEKYDHIGVLAVLSLCCLLVFATGVMIAADHSHPKTGKVGTLTLTSPLRIGDKVLEPGEYEVQHFNASSATGHFVQFTVIEDVGQTDVDGPTTHYGRRVVAQAPCKLEGLDKDAPQTIVKSEPSHGVRLEIKGENVAHLM